MADIHRKLTPLTLVMKILTKVNREIGLVYIGR